MFLYITNARIFSFFYFIPGDRGLHIKGAGILVVSALHAKKYKTVRLFNVYIFNSFYSLDSFACVLTWSLLKKACTTPRSVSFRGLLIQSFQQASPPLSYACPPGLNCRSSQEEFTTTVDYLSNAPSQLAKMSPMGSHKFLHSVAWNKNSSPCPWELSSQSRLWP